MAVQIPIKFFNDSVTDYQLKVLQDFDNRIISGKRFFDVVWHRRARKTTLAVNILIKECMSNPNVRYGYITSTYKAAKNIIWRDPNMLFKYIPKEIIKRKNETELFVEFINGTVLSIHGSDNFDSLRGVDFKGVVIDEWSICKADMWSELIRPIMALSKDRWAIFIYTPKGRNHAYSQHCMAKNAPDWLSYILKASESGIIPLEELENIGKEIPQRIFLQEFECVFNEDASGVFKGVDLCVSGKLEDRNPRYSYVTGVDLAKMADWTVICTMCRETRQVVSFKRFNQREWDYVKEMVIAEHKSYNSHVIIDATGVGDPIYEDLVYAKIPILPFKFTNESKKQLIERLMISIEQRLITFPDIDVLIDELKAFTYEMLPSGRIRYEAPSGLHDDCVIGLSLAVWGAKNYIMANAIPSGVNKTQQVAPNMSMSNLA